MSRYFNAYVVEKIYIKGYKTGKSLNLKCNYKYKIVNITLIAGARPNFMKIAPIIHAILRAQAQGKLIYYRLVHTGQHYDQKMSQTFFDELNIPEPDVNLGCGGGVTSRTNCSYNGSFRKRTDVESLRFSPSCW